MTAVDVAVELILDYAGLLSYMKKKSSLLYYPEGQPWV